MKTEHRGVEYWKERPADDHEVDWAYSKDNWVDGYMQSMSHPHRDLVIKALALVKGWHSLLEVGCNVGPNLWKIHDAFKNRELYGIDPSPAAVKYAEAARLMLGGPLIKRGEIATLSDRQFDVILADAVLMYIPGEEIREVMTKLSQKARKAFIIVDRFAESIEGEPSGHVTARNYTALLKENGFVVEAKKMAPEDWPGSVGWEKAGYIFIGLR